MTDYGKKDETNTFKSALEKSGMSQRDLCRMLGIHPGTVNRWCAQGRPDDVKAPRYAWAFLAAYSAMAVERRAGLLQVVTALCSDGQSIVT